MLRVMIVLGLLVLVPAAIVFWRLRERSVADVSADDKAQMTHSSALDRLHVTDPKALPHDGEPTSRR